MDVTRDECAVDALARDEIREPVAVALLVREHVGAQEAFAEVSVRSVDESHVAPVS